MITIVICVAVLAVLPHASDAEKNVPQEFTRKEAKEIFGVNDNDGVPAYTKISIQGLSTFKRDAKSSDVPVTLTVNAFGKQYPLNVLFNDEVVPKSHTLEFADSKGNIVKRYKGTPGEYGVGQVADDEESDVALHVDGKGVTGSIRTSDDMLIISPLPERMRDENVDHLIYRANDMPGMDSVKTLFKAQDDEPVFRRKRSVQTKYPKKTMELLLVGDYKFLEHHGADAAPQYLLNVANIMASVFRDSSLEYPLNVVVRRRIIFDTDMFHATTMPDYLRKFSDWAVHNNVASDSDVNHVDAAVLVTRSGGCANGCQAIGYAVMQTCGKKSEAVVRDDGIVATALAMAHEIGHILLNNHDGAPDNPSCPNGIYIMSSGVRKGGPTSFQWSKCVSNKLKELLLSPRSACFNDEPKQVISNSEYELYGQDYNRDKQCQYLLGSKFKGCTDNNLCKRKNGELFCHRTYCSIGPVVNVQFFPLLHGTYCGKNKWCIHGVCIPDGKVNPAPVDGSWAPWGDYAACNRKCHLGVQSKYRKCNEPTNGGKFCEGGTHGQLQSGYVRTCRVKDETCVAGVNDREQQCIAKNAKNYCSGCLLTLGKECMLFCGTGSWHGDVTDGTSCTSKFIHRGVCVSGKCKRMYCDESFDTGVEVDRCLKCGGDGTTCTEVKGSSDKAFHRSPNPQFVATIPANSWKIRIHKHIRNQMFMSFMLGSSTEWGIKIPQGLSKTKVIDGVTFKYITSERNSAHFHLTTLLADKPIKEPMHIKVLNFYGATTGGISWSYVIDTPSPLGEVYWHPEEYTPCNVACGGSGIQTRVLHCTRKDDKSMISANFCSSIKKPIDTRICGVIDCPPKWSVSAWGACSKDCAIGTRSRTINCIILTASKTNKVVDDQQCESSLKPKSNTTENCNIHACDPKWFPVSAFSDCSKTCGSGVSTRKVVCKRVTETGLAVVPDLECEAFYKLDKPASEIKCNQDKVCPAWKTEYTECSTKCGKGTQDVSVICRELPSDKLLPSSSCKAEDKPVVSGTVSCNKGPCAGYDWSTKDGPCSKACGKGILRVAIKCKNVQTNAIADYGHCDASTKPYGRKLCNLGTCIKEFIWMKRWSECSKSCGEGTKSTVPYCVKKSNISIEVEIIDCDVTEKPVVETDTCVKRVCRKHEWSVALSKCSPCLHEQLDGVKTSTVTCQNLAKKVVVADSMCGDDKPAPANEACKCPEVHYEWKLQQSECSVTCESGIITQKYICVDMSNGKQAMHERDCNKTNAKPIVHPTIPCQMRVCPVYVFKVDYGACNANCSNGYKITYADCVDNSIVPNEIVDGKHCKKLPIPPTNVPCTRERKCEQVFNQPQYSGIYRVGCFEDELTDRAFENSNSSFRDDLDWVNNTIPVRFCYNKAKKLKYSFFAIQYYGECWVGRDNAQYDKHGPATDCWEGLGATYSNFVYHIGSPIVLNPTPPLLRLGCYSYARNSKMALKDAWNEEKHHKYVRDCAMKWNMYKRNKKFGIDSTGKCLQLSEQEHIWEIHNLQRPCNPVVGELTKRYFLYQMLV